MPKDNDDDKKLPDTPVADEPAAVDQPVKDESDVPAPTPAEASDETVAPIEEVDTPPEDTDPDVGRGE